MAVLRLVGAVGAIAVDQAGARVRQVAVPDLVGAFRQVEARDLAPAGRIEQAELERCGVGGEDREVGAEPVPGGAQRIGSARQQAIGQGAMSAFGAQHDRGERRQGQQRATAARRAPARAWWPRRRHCRGRCRRRSANRCWRSRASGRRAARRCDSHGAAPASCCRRPGRADRLRLALAQEGEDGIGAIVADHPAEALGSAVAPMQRGLGGDRAG